MASFLLGLLLCTLFQCGASIVVMPCSLLPEVVLPAGVTRADFARVDYIIDDIFIDCPNYALGRAQFEVGGLQHWIFPYYKCDQTTGQLLPKEFMVTRRPIAVTCTTTDRYSLDFCHAQLRHADGDANVVTVQPANQVCAPGQMMKLEDGTLFKRFTCVSDASPTSKNTIELLNGTTIEFDEYYYFSIECVDPPTTTTTPDSSASSAHLWSVNYYYNYGHGVHAFCADSVCIKAIQSNGIGYDMVNGWGLLGRDVSESQINAVRAACPTGSQNLRNLGFTKSGKKYLHNLNGSGLKQGWVSVTSGSCGATVGIKRWKSRYTDDMMYGVNLEWNTWYKGMVQDGGRVQFYMWN